MPPTTPGYTDLWVGPLGGQLQEDQRIVRHFNAAGVSVRITSIPSFSSIIFLGSVSVTTGTGRIAAVCRVRLCAPADHVGIYTTTRTYVHIMAIGGTLAGPGQCDLIKSGKCPSATGGPQFQASIRRIVRWECSEGVNAPRTGYRRCLLRPGMPHSVCSGGITSGADVNDASRPRGSLKRGDSVLRLARGST